ncbi:proline-rich protein 2-like [Sceloporus undulatus]|uniref:proline-rich protein 2-like n=1 Tax=Sceloporus undulatus TaxID=8520 RepID=UPI001C4CB157|nr:proline-rich protein 2-like [Sceloporus undulatus]
MPPSLCRPLTGAPRGPGHEARKSRRGTPALQAFPVFCWPLTPGPLGCRRFGALLEGPAGRKLASQRAPPGSAVCCPFGPPGGLPAPARGPPQRPVAFALGSSRRAPRDRKLGLSGDPHACHWNPPGSDILATATCLPGSAAAGFGALWRTPVLNGPTNASPWARCRHRSPPGEPLKYAGANGLQGAAAAAPGTPPGELHQHGNLPPMGPCCRRRSPPGGPVTATNASQGPAAQPVGKPSCTEPAHGNGPPRCPLTQLETHLEDPGARQRPLGGPRRRREPSPGGPRDSNWPPRGPDAVTGATPGGHQRNGQLLPGPSAAVAGALLAGPQPTTHWPPMGPAAFRSEPILQVAPAAGNLHSPRGRWPSQGPPRGPPAGGPTGPPGAPCRRRRPLREAPAAGRSNQRPPRGPCQSQEHLLGRAPAAATGPLQGYR